MLTEQPQIISCIHSVFSTLSLLLPYLVHSIICYRAPTMFGHGIQSRRWLPTLILFLQPGTCGSISPSDYTDPASPLSSRSRITPSWYQLNDASPLPQQAPHCPLRFCSPPCRSYPWPHSTGLKYAPCWLGGRTMLSTLAISDAKTMLP